MVIFRRHRAAPRADHAVPHLRIRVVTGSERGLVRAGGAMFGTFFISMLDMSRLSTIRRSRPASPYLATSLAAFGALGRRLMWSRGSGLANAMVVVAGVRAGRLAVPSILLDGDVALPAAGSSSPASASASPSSPSRSAPSRGCPSATRASPRACRTPASRSAARSGSRSCSTLAITRTEDLAAGGTPQAEALTEGFQIALYAGVGLAVAGALAVMALVRSSRRAEAPVEAPVETVVAETASEGSTS